MKRVFIFVLLGVLLVMGCTQPPAASNSPTPAVSSTVPQGSSPSSSVAASLPGSSANAPSVSEKLAAVVAADDSAQARERAQDPSLSPSESAAAARVADVLGARESLAGVQAVLYNLANGKLSCADAKKTLDEKLASWKQDFGASAGAAIPPLLRNSASGDDFRNPADEAAFFADAFARVFWQTCPTPQDFGLDASQLPLTQARAGKLVYGQVAHSNPKSFVYLLEDKLLPGDDVKPAFGNGLRVSREYFFYFIDDDPFAKFSHPTRFVFVEPDTGKYFVLNEEWWPVVKGVSYWASYQTRLAPLNIFYPKNPDLNRSVNFSAIPTVLRFDGSKLARSLSFEASVAAICNTPDCCKGQGEKYAIVATGYDEPGFKKDTDDFYNMLVSQGFAADHVTYLSTSMTAGVSGINTINNLADAFLSMIQKLKKCDSFVFYTAAHGGNMSNALFVNRKTGEKETFDYDRIVSMPPADFQAFAKQYYYDPAVPELRFTVNPYFEESYLKFFTSKHGSPEGGRMYVSTVNGWLDAMQNCDKLAIFDTCHSELAALEITASGQCKRAIAAAGVNESSYATNEYGGYFTQPLIWALSHPGPTTDANGDGQVDTGEGFNYAKGKAQTYSDGKQHPVFLSTAKCDCCNQTNGTINETIITPTPQIPTPPPVNETQIVITVSPYVEITPAPGIPTTTSRPTPTYGIPTTTSRPTPTPSYFPTTTTRPTPTYFPTTTSLPTPEVTVTEIIITPAPTPAPTPVDCGLYCAGIGYPEVLGTGLSQSYCTTLGSQLPTKTCTTVCGYTKFQTWEYPGGPTFSCCCRAVNYLACSDCPGAHPTCPQTCPATPS